MIQSAIGTWHVEHFGDLGCHDALMRKFAEESGEFLTEPSPEEAADVCIVLLAWAHRQGFDLEDAIKHKFDIVKGRNQLARDQAKINREPMTNAGHGFVQGEMLPMVGGPLDGREHPVSIIFPFLAGGMPNKLVWFGDIWYTLDVTGRRWVYVEEGEDENE